MPKPGYPSAFKISNISVDALVAIIRNQLATLPQFRSLTSLINPMMLAFGNPPWFFLFFSPLFPVKMVPSNHLHHHHTSAYPSLIDPIWSIRIPQSSFLSTRNSLPLIPLRDFHLLFPLFPTTCILFPSIMSIPLSLPSSLLCLYLHIPGVSVHPNRCAPSPRCPMSLCLTVNISRKHPSCN